MSKIDGIVKDAIADAKAMVADLVAHQTVLVEGKEQPKGAPSSGQKAKAAAQAVAARIQDIQAAVVAQVEAGL
jgi:hypothetical protein